ncbi:glycosyltransferase family 39 protein [Candidatus Curtissbacteria bacterium]|nr:glycosyltransferase family 39 protein [Candidatus Curtissbacteria bacterium]
MKKSSPIFKHWPLLLVGILTLHLVLLVSIRFTAWPEMLFWPYLLTKGWLPYRDIAIAHTPFLVLVLSFFYKIVGVGIRQQQIISWLVVLLSDILLFFTIRNLFNIKKALLSLFFYIFLQVYYEGNGIWFDHALAPFVILIFFLLQKKRMFLAGIFWGLALVTKQTAFWFLFPIIFSKPTFSFFKGVILVLTIFVMGLLLTGLWVDFYHWAVNFGIGTLPRLTGQVSPPSTRELFSSLAPILIFIPFSPISFWPWLIAGSLGVMPRFEFFHFQPALPFLALLYAKAINRKAFIPLLLIVSIMLGRGLYRGLLAPPRFHDDNDKKIISLVKEKTKPGETIFVTGYWDNLYPLTETIPATKPFIPQLSWYLSQPGTSEGILSVLIDAKPKVAIRKKEPGAIGDYLDKNYTIVNSVGTVDILEIK